MGGYCSVDKGDTASHVEKNTPIFHQNPAKLVKKPHCQHQNHQAPVTDDCDSKPKIAMADDQYHFVEPLDAVIQAKSELEAGGGLDAIIAGGHLDGQTPQEQKSEYFRRRDELLARERTLGFDYRCRSTATELQIHADKVLQAVKAEDDELIYRRAPPRKGFGGQDHPRFYGDHFLSNVDLINETKLFAITRAMPKGAHLHIHFNANLTPDVLINIAKEMPCMYISSDLPLALVGEPNGSSPDLYVNLQKCRLQFHILSGRKVRAGRRPPPGGALKTDRNKQTLWLGNIFSPGYPAEPVVSYRPKMQFVDFRTRFSKEYPNIDVDQWLQRKLVFEEEEAHNCLQTAQGAWERFNMRTQMMKGLFNYERAYKEYTQKCLQEFVDDNIQYAEIRPNFMKANQLWTDDGEKLIDNQGIMNIIIKACEEFRISNPDFGGLKIIYCTPRSSTRDEVAASLSECLEFKRRWPSWIAGFDLLGEEGAGKPLKHFASELLQFKADCRAAELDIPFLFHCAETLECGGETDGNLLDALLLGSKRIGHGYGLDRHPYILEHMKKNNTCVELCPISNEILGLTPRSNSHTMYSLLARNVHCTVSTDNGTLFRSRLSHDFYEVYAGSQDMSLHGWRQLIEWSLDHSCMEPELQTQVRHDWERRWDTFCEWIIVTYGHDADLAWLSTWRARQP